MKVSRYVLKPSQNGDISGLGQPTPSQRLALSKLFGCVRVAWNDALAFCISEYKGGKKKPKNTELKKQFLTQAKKLEERKWLSEVSAIPLQQSLNDL